MLVYDTKKQLILKVALTKMKTKTFKIGIPSGINQCFAIAMEDENQ